MQLVLGHTDAGFDKNLISVKNLLIVPPLADPNSPIFDAVITTNGGQQIISISPNGRKFGRTEITVTISAAGEADIAQQFGVTVCARPPRPAPSPAREPTCGARGGR